MILNVLLFQRPPPNPLRRRSPSSGSESDSSKPNEVCFLATSDLIVSYLGRAAKAGTLCVFMYSPSPPRQPVKKCKHLVGYCAKNSKQKTRNPVQNTAIVGFSKNFRESRQGLPASQTK